MEMFLNAVAVLFVVGLAYSLIQILLGWDMPNWIG